MKTVRSVAERVAERDRKLARLAVIKAAAMVANSVGALRQELFRLIEFIEAEQG